MSTSINIHPDSETSAKVTTHRTTTWLEIRTSTVSLTIFESESDGGLSEEQLKAIAAIINEDETLGA